MAFMINLALSLAVLALLCGAAIKFIWGYKKEDWKAAGWKAFFLWIVSTSPVLVSIALSSPKTGGGEVWKQFFDEVLRRLTLTEMFVYSAAFLAPMLYVVFEVYEAYEKKEVKLTLKDINGVMRGIEKVFLTSIIILILTLIAYAGANTNNDVFSTTYISLFLQQKGYMLYIASLLIWYSVILWEKGPVNFSLESAQKSEEEDFKDKMARRRGEQ